jgi:hypothetical protein
VKFADVEILPDLAARSVAELLDFELADFVSKGLAASKCSGRSRSRCHAGLAMRTPGLILFHLVIPFRFKEVVQRLPRHGGTALGLGYEFGSMHGIFGFELRVPAATALFLGWEKNNNQAL